MMACPYLRAVENNNRAGADAMAKAEDPIILQIAIEWLAQEIGSKPPTLTAAHLDTSGPHPVLRPDPPPGTSDNDPTLLGPAVDDRRDTNI